MKWLGAASCVVLMVCLEWRRRRSAWLNGPHFVAHLREWYERDAYGDEPTIRQADLPPVKPLQARPAERSDRMRRFDRRLSR